MLKNLKFEQILNLNKFRKWFKLKKIEISKLFKFENVQIQKLFKFKKV
jgi:hypothetical protein